MDLKERIIDLLHYINRLHIENAAMRGVLGTLYVDGQPLNWAPLVRDVIDDQARTAPDRADEQFGKIDQSVRDAPDDQQAMIAFLLGLSTDGLWTPSPRSDSRDLTGKSLYLAVRCRQQTEHMIPLRIVEFDAEGVCPEGWSDGPFDSTCESCKTTQQFRGHEVIVWRGPLPNKNFRTHPSFQR